MGYAQELKESTTAAMNTNQKENTSDENGAREFEINVEKEEGETLI